MPGYGTHRSRSRVGASAVLFVGGVANWKKWRNVSNKGSGGGYIIGCSESDSNDHEDRDSHDTSRLLPLEDGKYELKTKESTTIKPRAVQLDR
jgi:hypothetical protein